jgi:hypothetical protein
MDGMTITIACHDPVAGADWIPTEPAGIGKNKGLATRIGETRSVLYLLSYGPW